MQRVRRKHTKNQRRETRRVIQQAMPLDDGTLTTPVTLSMIQALIPLGLRAVEEALLTEVAALAGPRYARDDASPDVVRWGTQRGSIFLADQKLPIPVPRVRDRRDHREVPLATYATLRHRAPRMLDSFGAYWAASPAASTRRRRKRCPRPSDWPDRVCLAGSFARARANCADCWNEGSMMRSGWYWSSTGRRSPAISW